MSFLKRLSPSKEIKAALGIVEECDLIFSTDALFGDSFKIIKAELIPYIHKSSDILEEYIKEGQSVRSCVYTAIATIAQSHVTSGEYHIYRGILNSISPGAALLEICDKAIDLLVKEGSLTQENSEQWKADIREQISEVG